MGGELKIKRTPLKQPDVIRTPVIGHVFQIIELNYRGGLRLLAAMG